MVFQVPPSPLWPSEIRDFEIEPRKPTYAPGERVVFKGKLVIHKVWWEYQPRGRAIEIWGDMVKTSFEGVTDTDGRFTIDVVLPAEPIVVTYRARFPGYDWAAAEDESWSDVIMVNVVVVPPVEVHKPPVGVPKPIPWERIALYAAIGLMALGVLAMLTRRP